MNYLKSTFIAALSILAVFSTVTHAGSYAQPGYITNVSIDIPNYKCTLSLAEEAHPGSKIIQKGQWRCWNALELELFKTSHIAMLLGLKTIVTFEGDGSEYKPVYAISIQ